MKAIIALGANLGDARANLLRALDRLQTLSDAPILRSSLWSSEPVDCPPGSPNFVNAVALLVPRERETPETLLAHLQRIEREFGRRPRQRINEPRPLDLDLIAFGAELRNTPELALPHPRAHQRRFVLGPLCELEPDLVLPRQTRTVGQLLSDLAASDSGARDSDAAGGILH